VREGEGTFTFANGNPPRIDRANAQLMSPSTLEREYYVGFQAMFTKATLGMARMMGSECIHIVMAEFTKVREH
jgi:hypothetical protein